VKESYGKVVLAVVAVVVLGYFLYNTYQSFFGNSPEKEMATQISLLSPRGK
jgi:hypothetical protein